MAHGGLHVAGSCPGHRWERLQVVGQQAGGAGGRLRQALLRWLGCDLRLAAVGGHLWQALRFGGHASPQTLRWPNGSPGEKKGSQSRATERNDKTTNRSVSRAVSCNKVFQQKKESVSAATSLPRGIVGEDFSSPIRRFYAQPYLLGLSQRLKLEVLE